MLLPTPPFPLMTTSLCLMPTMRSWTCRVCSVICWTTFASSVYCSLLRIAFKSFSAIFREALNVQSQDPYALRKQHRIFFFQAEDGIRDLTVTGVQTCALPI